jgi:hypothetical protein
MRVELPLELPSPLLYAENLLSPGRAVAERCVYASAVGPDSRGLANASEVCDDRCTHPFFFDDEPGCLRNTLQFRIRHYN